MSFRRVLAGCAVSALSLPALASGIARQLTDQTAVSWSPASVDAAGSRVYAASNTDLVGSNPDFLWQLLSWDAASGAGSVIATPPNGAQTNRSAVSDDGLWLAYLSAGDVTGGNPDGTTELFLMRTDGSVTRQLTTAPGGGGDVKRYALSGSGNRVVFVADTDPLGSNPSRVRQLFVVDADGTNLRQLTTTTAIRGFTPSISDDGSRIAFEHAGDLTGGNPDLTSEVFAILSDGTGLRQITSSAGTSDSSGALSPRVSGNGVRIAFESAENLGGLNALLLPKVWTVDWAGTNLKPVTASGATGGSPAITDDGQFVFYVSQDSSAGNTDFSPEIWKVKFDGTSKARLTSTAGDSGCAEPEVSGGGGRVAFRALGAVGGVNLDGGNALVVMDGAGANMRELVEASGAWDSSPDITADGTRVVFDSGRDPFGTNPSSRQQLFRVQADGTGLAQVTTLTDGDVWHARIADDGQTIVFVSNANPTGTNPNHDFEPFAVRADGSGLVQLTPTNTAGSGAQETPAISGNGAWVVFQTTGDPTGGNADGSPELFRVRPDGTGMLRLTSDDDSVYKLPRVDASGTWATYMTSAGIHRIRTDGTGFQTIASFGFYPDISGDGSRIAFVSYDDPFGTNPDRTGEVFVWDAATSLVRQVTSLPSGAMGRVRVSRDGAFVLFATSAPVFEANPLGWLQPYRVEIATGAIERIGALGASIPEGSARYGDYVATDGSGRRLAYKTVQNPAGRNSDLSTEVFRVDLDGNPRIHIGRDSPTVVSWDADPHAVRYDVIRGDVANLRLGGVTVDLGAVTCLADDHPALQVTDADGPAPGQAFFFLLRGTQGASSGPGSYGQGSGGRERSPGSGGCAD